LHVASLYGLDDLRFETQWRVKILRTWPRGPPILYNGYWGSFPEAKQPGHGVDHLPHLAPRFSMNRVQL